jgi:hypothetical protein
MKSLSRRMLFGLPVPFFAARQAEAADAPGSRPTATPVSWNQTELYFGTSQPNGSVVTDEQFGQFIDLYVTPRFPDGLTLLSGDGQFRSFMSNVIIKEKSKLLILFYPPQMTDANKKIQEIRELYKTMFLQESVLRADSRAAISF